MTRLSPQQMVSLAASFTQQLSAAGKSPGGSGPYLTFADGVSEYIKFWTGLNSLIATHEAQVVEALVEGHTTGFDGFVCTNWGHPFNPSAYYGAPVPEGEVDLGGGQNKTPQGNLFLAQYQEWRPSYAQWQAMLPAGAVPLLNVLKRGTAGDWVVVYDPVSLIPVQVGDNGQSGVAQTVSKALGAAISAGDYAGAEAQIKALVPIVVSTPGLNL